MTAPLPPTAWALLAATLMIAHQVAGKATRDAVFLSQFDVSALPRIVILAAILSIAAVVVFSRLLVRHGPLRVIRGALLLSSACFVVDWLVMPARPAAVAVALYLQMAIFGAVLISGFWSVINERFDPYSAKQTIAKVGAAATLGGVLGGVLAGQVPTAIDLRAMLLALAVLHVACALAVAAIGESRRPEHAPAPVRPSLLSGFQLLLSHRYLQLMGCLMLAIAVLAGLLDYAFKSQASATLLGGEALAAFFGQFYAVVGVLTFAVQSLLGPRVLKRHGIGVTLAIMPALTVVLGAVTLALPRLGSLVVMRAAQMSLGNSFFRSAFEVLYTPLPPLIKRPTKAIIDVASDRLGDMLSSGILLAILLFVPAPGVRLLTVFSLVVASLVLYLVLLLYRGYVAQLAESLREGAISLSDDVVYDATTRVTLAEASAGSERELLMARIRQRKQAQRGGEARAKQVRAAREVRPDPDAETLAQAIRELGSGEQARIRRCLHGGFMNARLAPSLVPLLAEDPLAADVRTELRWMAPQIVGVLSDAMGNPDLPLAARQRLPSVLEVVHNPRAVSVLLQGLQEEEFNIRYSCARALLRMRGRDPYMALPEHEVFAAIAREVNVDQGTWASRDLQMEVDLPEDLAASPDPAEMTLNYSMEHVFTLLGLVLDREALSLALHAVASSDRNLSGTALEYLENVLPEDVRRALWPRLRERDGTSAPPAGAPSPRVP